VTHQRLIQELFEETSDLVYPVDKLYFQNPVPDIALFVWLKYIAMIVRMYIQTHIAGRQLLMWIMTHDMARYLSAEFPAVSFRQIDCIVEKGSPGKSALPGIPGPRFMSGGFYISF
jgi:hypothetical protein